MNQNPNVLIYLRQVNHKDLQNLLTFMYQGVVDVSEQDLPRFLEIAEDLNIRGLSEANLDSFNSEENTSQIYNIQQERIIQKLLMNLLLLVLLLNL